MARPGIDSRSLRGWLRANRTLALFLYGAVLASCAYCLTRPVLLVNDGHIYMEMARSLREGHLEIDNGLNIVDSPELLLRHTVKRGLHLYGKYPPLYAVLAALPYGWFGIRGMYLLNAIGMAFLVPAVDVLGRRILRPARALAASLLFPLVIPVVPYALLELPHLVSTALVLWAIVLWDDCLRAAPGARASLLGATAGFLAGVAFGVRVQIIVAIAPLLAIGFAGLLAVAPRELPRRAAPMLSFVLAFGACVAAVAAFNVARFGSPNPLSYGVSEIAAGQPIDEETAGYFLRPAVFLTAGIPLSVLAIAPRVRRASTLAILVAAVALIVLVTPALHAEARRMGGAAGSLLVNASVAGAGWSTPFWTFGWMSKALLVSAPFLVLGLVGSVVACARPARRLTRALGWMVVATIVFLSMRDPDPLSGRGAMVFFSLSPRYLVDVMPLLYLLAWRQLGNVRFRPVHLAIGAASAVAFAWFMWVTGPDAMAPFKQRVIASGSIALAALLLAGRVASRQQSSRAVLLGIVVAVANGYAMACAFAEDSRFLVSRAHLYEDWGQRLLAATPERAAIVGWRFGKDGILHVRSERPFLIVEPWVDHSASLPRTLDALAASGIPLYYFGSELQHLPHLDGYRVVPLLEDPILLRLERIVPGGARQGM
jgi:hypothetical protein